MDELRCIGYANAGEIVEALLGDQCDPLLTPQPDEFGNDVPVFVKVSDLPRIIEKVKAQGSMLSGRVEDAEASILGKSHAAE